MLSQLINKKTNFYTDMKNKVLIFFVGLFLFSSNVFAQQIEEFMFYNDNVDLTFVIECANIDKSQDNKVVVLLKSKWFEVGIDDSETEIKAKVLNCKIKCPGNSSINKQFIDKPLFSITGDGQSILIDIPESFEGGDIELVADNLTIQEFPGEFPRPTSYRFKIKNVPAYKKEDPNVAKYNTLKSETESLLEEIKDKEYTKNSDESLLSEIKGYKSKLNSKLDALNQLPTPIVEEKLTKSIKDEIKRLEKIISELSGEKANKEQKEAFLKADEDIKTLLAEIEKYNAVDLLDKLESKIKSNKSNKESNLTLYEDNNNKYRKERRDIKNKIDKFNNELDRLVEEFAKYDNFKDCPTPKMKIESATETLTNWKNILGGVKVPITEGYRLFVEEVNGEYLQYFKDVDTNMYILNSMIDELRDDVENFAFNTDQTDEKLKKQLQDSLKSKTEKYENILEEYDAKYQEYRDKCGKYESGSPELEDLNTSIRSNIEKADQSVAYMESLIAPAKAGWIIPFAIGFALLIGGLLFYLMRERKKKLDKLAAQRAANTVREITGDTDEEDLEIEIDMGDGEDSIQVIAGEIDNLNFVTPEKFHKLDLNKIWDGETLVTACHVSKEVFVEINEFCKTTSTESEAGGFLLGRHCKIKGTGREQYEITIEKFVIPAKTEHQDLYQIKFGTKSMLDLDNELVRNSELGLIGWFHTHPGHSPFLSNPDLNIHDGSFSNMWQVALVIDPKIEGFAAGLFTKKNGRKMNNFMAHSDNSKYIMWKEVAEKLEPVKKDEKLDITELGENNDLNLEENSAKNEITEFDIKNLFDNLFIKEIKILPNVELDFKDDLKIEDGKVYGDLYGKRELLDDSGENYQYAIHIENIQKENNKKPDNMLNIGIALKTNSEEAEIFEKIKEMHAQKSKKEWQITMVYYEKYKKVGFYAIDTNDELCRYNDKDLFEI